MCVSETAQRLVQLGHQVTVLTTMPNYPGGIVPPAYCGRILQEELLSGVRVIRVWCYVSANRGFLRRVLAQLSFGCLAPLLGGKSVGRPDVIIVGSPPLFNIIAGRILARQKRCPFIFWVADLWPESAIQFGVLRNSVFIKLATWLEWSSYRRSSLVWVVAEGVRNLLIQRGLPPEQIYLLTNGVDSARFRPLPQAEARASFGWDERFTVLYAGTHGLAHGLMSVLAAAERLRNDRDIRFVFAGDGEEKARLVAYARTHDLKNVLFLDPLPHARMPLLLAAADVCLVSMRKLPLLETTLPLKMFEIMACARPMLLSARGEARKVAEQRAGAALSIEPEDAEALVCAILYIKGHPEVARQLGQRGRHYVERHFDYDRLTAALNERLHLLLGR